LALKAVFITRDCLLPSGWPEVPAAELQLRPGTAEGLQALAASKLFLIVLDRGQCGMAVQSGRATDGGVMPRLLELVRSTGGRVDALLQCPHQAADGCGCWGSYPGFLYAAASQLELRLEECYLLCTEPNDVLLAYRAGCRPLLVLNEHGISDLYDGHQPEPRDFPMARDLGIAVQYLLVEEGATEQWGRPRQPSSLSQVEEEIPVSSEGAEFSPMLRLLSPVPGRKGALLLNLPQLSRNARQWLAVFVFGGVWLSLGIAYLLTHLYRVHPFPAFVWYLTLQFIPRPVRGLLFILTGLLVVVVSLRAFWHLFPGNGRRRGG